VHPFTLDHIEVHSATVFTCDYPTLADLTASPTLLSRLFRTVLESYGVLECTSIWSEHRDSNPELAD